MPVQIPSLIFHNPVVTGSSSLGTSMSLTESMLSPHGHSLLDRFDTRKIALDIGFLALEPASPLSRPSARQWIQDLRGEKITLINAAQGIPEADLPLPLRHCLWLGIYLAVMNPGVPFEEKERHDFLESVGIRDTDPGGIPGALTLFPPPAEAGAYLISSPLFHVPTGGALTVLGQGLLQMREEMREEGLYKSTRNLLLIWLANILFALLIADRELFKRGAIQYLVLGVLPLAVYTGIKIVRPQVLLRRVKRDDLSGDNALMKLLAGALKGNRWIRAALRREDPDFLRNRIEALRTRDPQRGVRAMQALYLLENLPQEARLLPPPEKTKK